MRIGAIVRCDYTGLGIQSKEFFDHVPCKALVIDSTKLSGGVQNHHWYPDQKVVKIDSWMKIPKPVLDEFLHEIDALITFETPYDYSIFDVCRRKGIKTILQLNYEFLEYPSNKPQPDVFASPSLWHYHDIPDPKMYLPVPVNTKHFTPQVKEKTFVHVCGRPAIHDRNGTFTFLESLRYVKNNITVHFKAQTFTGLKGLPPNVRFFPEFGHKGNYYENYSGGVLVMPRKYGGLCLPMNEAIACEMPIITTDISPNNEWLPKEWLVPARHAGSFKCKTLVDIFEADVRQLASKIDEFCDQSFYLAAVERTKAIKKKISWEKLLPVYKKLFS